MEDMKSITGVSQTSVVEGVQERSPRKEQRKFSKKRKEKSRHPLLAHGDEVELTGIEEYDVTHHQEEQTLLSGVGEVIDIRA